MNNLISDRLILRPITKDDDKDMYEWTSDKEVSRYVSWNIHKDIDETRAFIDYLNTKEKKGNKYIFGIQLKNEEKLIGMIDLQDIDVEVPEIGYIMNRKYWNQGYMTEALKRLVLHLFEEGYEEVFIRADVKNIGSNKVIIKSGFKFTGTGLLEVTAKNKTITTNEYIINNRKD